MRAMSVAENPLHPDDLGKRPGRQGLSVRAKNVIPQPGELVHPLRYLRNQRFVEQLKREGYTMVSTRRGRNLIELARAADSQGLEGALVDCGVWNGGSTTLLGTGALGRDVWAFDSFEGLPKPGPRDPDAHADWEGEAHGSEEKLREAFTRYAGRPDRLHVVKGWFNDTFPQVAEQIGPIALIHIDADWFDPCLLALETFYDKVVPGGYVAVDDLRMWQGARDATDEFRGKRGITAKIRSAHYWQKP